MKKGRDKYQAVSRRSSPSRRHRDRLRPVFYLISFLIFVAMAVVGWTWVSDPQTLPIKAVKVVATYRHTDAEALEKVIMPHVMQGFLGVRAKRLRKELLAMPWVRDVSIQRVWPNALIVRVYEKQAVARWGEDRLLSQKGVIFQPAKLTKILLPP